ncbi:hypothetical protein AWENTII_006610 [Aspergillus wentii]
MPRTQWIKLELDPDQKPGINSSLSSTYSDCRSIPTSHHTSPEGIVTDYLRSLREHTLKVLKKQVGKAIEKMALEFVITVPAVWSDKAKTKTLSCAEEAGFGESAKIRIISEPEAAAMHTLQASNPHGLDIGDTIVICDAGGGTVDLITFSIIEFKPNLRLKEEAPGTGSLCGSTFLNRRFEEFIEERLSSCPGWGRDTLEQAVDRFETVAKRTCTGNPDDDFMFPVPGILDNKENGVCRGRFHVTGREMKGIFLPVLRDVHNLVEDQIQKSKKQVKAVFLVGGFGQSPYLRKYLRDWFPDIEILVPVDGWTAVVRGALTKAIGDISTLAPQASVESRVARKNYGMLKSTKFIDELHDERKKYWDYFSGEYSIDVMDWFIQKGDAIKEAEAIETRWLRNQRTRSGTFDSISVTIYELDTPLGESAPLYFNRRMKQHAFLNPSLGVIQKARIPICLGKDGKNYNQIHFQIHAAYFSAHCEYTLWYEGKNHGSVKVDYV